MVWYGMGEVMQTMSVHERKAYLKGFHVKPLEEQLIDRDLPPTRKDNGPWERQDLRVLINTYPDALSSHKVRCNELVNENDTESSAKRWKMDIVGSDLEPGEVGQVGQDVMRKFGKHGLRCFCPVLIGERFMAIQMRGSTEVMYNPIGVLLVSSEYTTVTEVDPMFPGKGVSIPRRDSIIIQCVPYKIFEL